MKSLIASIIRMIIITEFKPTIPIGIYGLEDFEDISEDTSPYLEKTTPGKAPELPVQNQAREALTIEIFPN